MAELGFKFAANKEVVEYYQKWLELLRYERNNSDHTIINYASDLSDFLAFLNGHLGSELTTNNIQNLTISDFRGYLIKRRDENLANSSLARQISAIKNFFRFLLKNYKIDNEPIKNLSKPRVSKKLPRALSEGDLEQLKKAIFELDEELWVNKRDLALLTLIYGAGLRISEALNVIKGDLESNILRVKGKGNKERIVPLLPIIKEQIDSYMNECPYINQEDEFVFYSKTGKKLTASLVQYQMKHLRRLAGLAENVTPHSLRHSFASHLLANGADLRSIQELLGHANLSSTEIYTKVQNKQLEDVYLRAHPRK